MTSGEYRMAAERLEEIQREVAAANRQYALGALERLAEVLSGAALGFPVDRLAQCSRELAAAAGLLAAGAASARRIAAALEAVEAAAALPLPPPPDRPASPEEWPDAWSPQDEWDDSDDDFEDEEDFPEMDLLSRIRAAGRPAGPAQPLPAP